MQLSHPKKLGKDKSERHWQCVEIGDDRVKSWIVVQVSLTVVH
jgi:hypothetical protein